MLKSGDVLELDPLGMKFLIKRTGSDTGGHSFEMEWELGPKTGGTPIHVHPEASETYEVLEGTLDLYVNGEWQTLSRGESLTVPKNVPHTFRNSSTDTIRVYNVHRPAMDFAGYFSGLEGVVKAAVPQSGKMTPKGLFSLAALMTSYPREIRSVSPPAPVMKIMGSVGRMLGYGPHRPVEKDIKGVEDRKG